MTAQTVRWLIFLAVLKNFLSSSPIYFTLEDIHLTAKEGSCLEIKCRVTFSADDANAHWFWMKNPKWNDTLKDYFATIIYSASQAKRPVSAEYADRVTYTGSPSSSWKNRDAFSSTQPQCSILICNLNKSDSGNYSFRFVATSRDKTWTTNAVILTVTENPCPITFEKPPDVKEGNRTTLTCFTLSSCPSYPKIGDFPSTRNETIVGKRKITTVSLPVTWEDDGRKFSCQTPDNKDKYLIRNVNLTVEYAPKDTLAKLNHSYVIEGQTVTLTCSAKGNPEPTFTWFKNGENHTGAVWKIDSIDDSMSEEYRCEATNKYGTGRSDPVTINVTYAPQVEVTVSPAAVVVQGHEMTLTCEVKRSNPQPHSYVWSKDHVEIQAKGKTYVVNIIQPEHNGSYTCKAINSAGAGTSTPLKVTVQYGPRKTIISSSQNKVKVDQDLTFTCDTDANPAPKEYSWFRYSQSRHLEPSKWKSHKTGEKSLRLNRVQRADEACYRCNATNDINTGEDSEALCINVLYPPTKIELLMDTEVKEGQHIAISCTVESSPSSKLTLTRTSQSNQIKSNRQHSEEVVIGPDVHQNPNTLSHTIEVTSSHRGFYSCSATNSEGSARSSERELVVKYRPEGVIVQAKPGLEVNENASLVLHCVAQSHPPVTSVTWMKMTDGKREIIWATPDFTIKSVSPSDSAQYSCEARNEMGAGTSQQADVKVRYAPKHTQIVRGAEQQQPDGTSYVTLSCSSHSYPRVTHYSWYKINKEGRHEKMSNRQNYTVYSDAPGAYYCKAKNDISLSASDPIQLFDRSFMNILKLFFLCLGILVVICLIVFVYRCRSNKSVRQRSTNTLGSQGWWTATGRRNLMAEPFRSRDDLLPDQLSQHQPVPDSTPASNINSVYSTVNMPFGEQGASANKPIRQRGGNTVDESLNYASLHFGEEQKKKKAKADADVVYAMVAKQPVKDYENANTAQAAGSPDPLSSDTDTSEDEVELQYSQVSFKAKLGHQRAGRDSSSETSSETTSSDEETTHYSGIKI